MTSKTKFWRLDRDGEKPLLFEGECLTDAQEGYGGKTPEAPASPPMGASLFRTKAGRMVMAYQGRSSQYDTFRRFAALDAETIPDAGIISICGSYYKAKPILDALGREKFERIE